MANSFHHVKFYVSDALKSAEWYCQKFGFNCFVVKRREETLEIGIRNGKIVLLFKSALEPCSQAGKDIADELQRHGDFVKDVAFAVDDLHLFIELGRKYGLEVIEEVTRCQDENGSVLMTSIRSPTNGIQHTLIQNIDYAGPFLPYFETFELALNGTNNRALESVELLDIDHVVEAHPEHTLPDVVNWYEKLLHMRRFWSIDEQTLLSKGSSMRAMFIANAERKATMVLVEPVDARGQIQEFLDHNNGPGIQHIAFRVDNIMTAVRHLRERGVEFLSIPNSYYKQLRARLANSGLNVKEDLETLNKLGILLDFDEQGYLLQIFTHPVLKDRRTLFIEVIQRHNFEGFGAANLKALFSAVEMEMEQQNRPEATKNGH